MPRMMFALVLLCLAQGGLAASGARIAVEKQEGKLVVRARIAESERWFELATFVARAGERAYLHPVYEASGRQVLTDDKPSDHPWQHGIFTGFHRVNGFNYWKEDEGRQKLVEVSDVKENGDRVSWKALVDLVDPKGTVVLRETDEITIHAPESADEYRIDFELTLRAGEARVQFGKFFVGGLSVRMPWEMPQEKDRPVQSHLNSNGLRNRAAEQQRANWCTVERPFGNDRFGIAIFDHPENANHPPAWRVDEQGLINPNVSGLADWALAPNEEKRFKYRLLVYRGSAGFARLSGEFARFGRGENSASGKLPRFRKQILTDKYYCDGITAGDINQDGTLDIIAGPFWYEGPDFARQHEFYRAVEFPKPPSPTDSMFSYTHDFNGDGWLDILVLGRVHLHSAYWYENPKGAAGHWKKHFVFERIKGESPPFLDITGDGRPELAAHWENRWGLIQPNRADATQPWEFKPISGPGNWEQFYHGTGAGDLNGDGRLDLLLNEGWYEQPSEGNGEWVRHEFKFGNKGGAQMFAYDVNGDGQNDVISALDAHGWGLAWFEAQHREGRILFEKHPLMGDRSEEGDFGVAFSQPHALELADLNGDGLKDIIVGKRLWAHGPTGDVEPNAAPVLYWFELRRDGQGGAKFSPHLIDDQSGVGVQLTVADVNGDQRPDILTVSKLGAFVFFNEKTTNGR